MAVDGDDAALKSPASPTGSGLRKPQIPPRRDGDVPLADLADREPRDERVLRAAANSPSAKNSGPQV